MGGAASVCDLPDVLTESDCRGIAGQLFDETLFKSSATNGTISKQKLAQIMAIRTDCFLTHDWGKDLGQDNHARVALLNSALQKRGLKTWFDAEKMQGNIKKQMVSGIDNTQCVVVFITKRYNEKVAGDNTEDNCQLEFNYAALRKSAVRMVSVVMEERVRNTREWIGEVAMVLGGRLYVDVCGDLSDPSYLNTKADELYAAILNVIKTPLNEADPMMSTLSAGSIDGSSLPVTSIASGGAGQDMSTQKTSIPGSASQLCLKQLNCTQVLQLFNHCNMHGYDNMIKENDITGMVLSSSIDSWNDLVDVGMKALPAKALYKLIVEWKEEGVPDIFQLALDTTQDKQATAMSSSTTVMTKDEEKFNNNKLLAEQGNKTAQYELAVAYNYGKGVAKNEQKAVSYYILAADQGHTGAQYNLGLCYADGTGVTKDEMEAVRYYKMAADQGHASAQYNLGNRYKIGTVVTKDEKEAVRYYKMAADQDHASAQCSLGLCYDDGIGVTKDEKAAVRYYKMSADQGYASAQFNLSLCYVNGTGVTKDEKAAVRYYKMAADQGHASAQYNLGNMYKNGTGVTKDEKAAARYYKMAADQGHASALTAMAK